MEIKVLKDILSANDQLAEKNRQLLDSKGVVSVNMMASPGAGKTSLIVETIRRWKDRFKIGVVEGDISSSWDSEIVGKEGVPVVQINTGGECHLDANMIQNAISNLPLDDIELLIIENVGNLVCPAEFNTGAHKKVLVSSTPEGHDKPYKYPLMFHEVDAMVLNKIDLLPHLNFDTDVFTKGVKGINGKAEVFQLSCVSGEGIEQWTSWLLKQMGRG